MKTPSLILWYLLFLPACACGVTGLDDAYDENGKPTLESTGHHDSDDEKADSFGGRQGPSMSMDGGATEVWAVRRQWDDLDEDPGLAWPGHSGMSWDQKFSAWVDSLQRSGSTYELSTPYGRVVDAPDLECAELAMFLRIAFSSWYGLPFFMEARSGGQRVFFGHMGIVTMNGEPWRSSPRFRNRFEDFSAMAMEVRDDPDKWPRDAELRQRKITGKADDSQVAFGGAHAGTYFDEVFLNKRVGYFLTMQLAYLGSVNLADAANTYNLRADAFAPGDFLVERFAATGVGHTVIVKEVRELDSSVEVSGSVRTQREVEVVSGSMPRRQGAWEGPTTARYYFLAEDFGGQRSVGFGAGLKRFRSAVARGGRWTNTVLSGDTGHWINSTDAVSLMERQNIYEKLLPSLAPEERMAALAAKIESDREWLRSHPSSCSARTRREDFFDALYDAGSELGMNRQEVDRAYRRLEDYVFAELEYDESRTCCWNSSTPGMYLAVMKYNQCLLGEAQDLECDALDEVTQGSCQPPRIFMARDDGEDGFDRFARFGAANGYDWNEWSADETCPQADTQADALARSAASSYCELRSEEPFPMQPSCPAETFKCAADECIPQWWQCDGDNDCGDLSDELGCD